MAAAIPTQATSLVALLEARAREQGERTLYTCLADGETESERLSFTELARRARAIGASLQEIAAPGERALLLYPPGLGFVEAFFGCLYAGLVAVPVHPPRANRGLPRLLSTLADAKPALALTTGEDLAKVESWFAEAAELRPRCVATDCLPPELSGGRADRWRDLAAGPETIAFLQYTSGSTAAPKGVMISHGNLLHNSAGLALGLEHGPGTSLVSWLPTFHDLGLIYGLLQPLYSAFPAFLIPPLAFLQRPLRWLQALSRYRATHSAAPNFAYDLAVRKSTPQQRRLLDLGAWQVAITCAEPVRRKTMERFADAFGVCGFRLEAFCPAYGLAEGTLRVTAAPLRCLPRFCDLDAEELQRNRIRIVPDGSPGATSLVGCGEAEADTEVAIVDPERLVHSAADEVGEIWVRGPSVARGYWSHRQETEATFGARLADGEGPFLHTGDLGFVRDGHLFITGRIKDLVILAGRNLYPQDIELTVEQSHPAVRAGCCAAFSLDIAGEEQLIVAAELERWPTPDVDQVVRAIRRAVAEEHDVRVHEVLPIRIGRIPKTSSGKIQRGACRAGYLANSLTVLAARTAEAPR